MEFKHIIWNLTKKDIDMVNVLINIVERYTKFEVGNTVDYKSPIYILDVTYHDLAPALGYLHLDYKVVCEINAILDNLAKTHASIFYNDNGDRFMENTTFLLKYMLSSTDKGSKRDLDKRFSIMLGTSLIKILTENKEWFRRFYTHDKYDLRGKYSTILYDTLASKAKGSNTIALTFTLDELINIFDFDLEESTNIESWTKINSNILKRATKDITTKSNMYLTYDKVKDKVDDVNRVQTTSVRFEVALAPESDETPDYFTEECLMERKIDYYMEREINRKLVDLKKLQDAKVRDEEAYRFTERQKLKKYREEFFSKVKIQEVLNWIKYNDQTYEKGLVCFYDYKGHEYVSVNSDHILADAQTHEVLTKNAIETYQVIQGIIKSGGERYGVMEADHTEAYSISYSKG